MDYTQRLDKFVGNGWMMDDGSPGVHDPLAVEYLKSNPDPVAAALALVSGMPVSKLLEIFPLEKGLTNAPEYKGQVVTLNNHGASRAMFGVKTATGIVPIPTIDPKLKQDLLTGDLGEGVIIQDAQGVYLSSVELNGELVELGRDGKEVNRTPAKEANDLGI